MNGHFMQYVGEELRKEYVREINHQVELKNNRKEALAAQLAAREEGITTTQPGKPLGHSPFGLVKVAFLHLAGRRNAPVTR